MAKTEAPRFVRYAQVRNELGLKTGLNLAERRQAAGVRQKQKIAEIESQNEKSQNRRPTPGLPKGEGLRVSVLEARLRIILIQKGWESKEISKLFRRAATLQKQYEKKGKGLRDSGDKTITHSLRIMLRLAYLEFTDPVMMEAALLHDAKEDLPLYWNRLSAHLPSEVRSLVDAVTNIKSRNLNGSKSDAETKKKDDRDTNEKLLKTIQTDPRALIIKLIGDVADNSETYGKMKKASSARIKADRVLRVFDPVHLALTDSGIADRNADNAFKILHPTDFASIEKSKAKALKRFRRKHKLGLMDMLRYYTEAWQSDIMGMYSSDPLINHGAISVETRSVYRIYQRNGKNPSTEDTYPYIKILCETDAQRAQWNDFLKKFYHANEQNGGQLSNGRLLAHLPIPSKENGNKKQGIPIEVLITTMADEIKPDILYKSNGEYTQMHRQIAQAKLEDLTALLASAVYGDVDLSVSMPETLNRGYITFRTRDNEVMMTAVGSTALDAVCHIERGLANQTAAIVLIQDNGSEKLIGFNYPIFDGMQIRAYTRDELQNNPQLMIKLRAQANTNVELKAQLEDGLKGVLPSRFDYVTTQTAIDEIIEGLDPENEAVKKSSRLRAIKLIDDLYNEYEPYGRNLDQYIEDGYNYSKILPERYGVYALMLEDIGLIPIPNREAFIPLWKDLGDYTLPPENTRAYNSLKQIEKDLVNFRRTRPVLRIENLDSRSGVGAEVFKILGELSIDVIPVHARAVNEDPNQRTVERAAEIEFVLREITQEKFDKIQQKIKAIYPSAVLSLTIFQTPVFNATSNEIN